MAKRATDLFDSPADTGAEQQPTQQPAPAPAVRNGRAEVPAKAEERPAVHDNSTFSALMDSARFSHLQRVAQLFAASTLVPDAFRNQPANCFIALQMAMRLNCEPFAFIQGCYVVHGRPGIEAKLAIALANGSGVFSDRIKWVLTGEGMGRSCIAFAHDARTGDRCEAECTMKLAQAESWIDKSGSKWKTMPDLMLRYRSAMMLIRLYAPEVLIGLYSREELEDIAPEVSVRRGEAVATVAIEDLMSPQLAATEEPAVAEPKE